MTSSQNFNLSPMIDVRFTEEDLHEIYIFEYDENKKKSATCKMKQIVNGESIQCNFKASGTSVFKKFNLWRHVKRSHIDIYGKLVIKKDREDEVAEKRKRVNQENRMIIPSPSSKKSKTDQPKINSYFTSPKITVTMDSNTFREGLVEMVCMSMTPLTTFSLNNKGFQKIAGEMAQKLGVSTGHDAIRHLVISTADAARVNLKQTLKGQLCYLKMDAATRGNRNFLAINVQYWNEKRNITEIKTLDIVDTEGRHSSLYVKNQIKKTLEKFEIDEKQVLSICVDNAANMTCAVNKLSDNETNPNNMCRNLTEIISPDEEDGNNKEINEDISQQWVKDPSLILPTWSDDTKIQLMRCGIHTLQLAIWDGLKTENTLKILGKIRRVVVKLRTPTIRNLLLKTYGKVQSLDTITRWGSTYAMLDRLLFFKDYCDQVSASGMKELELSQAEWDEIKNIRDILEKPNISTIALQAADLTPGMFVKEWFKLEKHMEEFGGSIAQGILCSMKKRKEKLFLNTHFLAGVYVDSRYRILLNSALKLKAKEGLANIQQRLNRMILFNISEDPVIIETLSHSTESLDSEEDDFEKELDRRENSRRISTTCNKLDDMEHFEDDCTAIEGMGRQKVKTVFEAIDVYPERIRKACNVASSMPTSQASVERLFSGLKLVLSDNRQSMKDDLLSAILFNKVNI